MRFKIPVAVGRESGSSRLDPMVHVEGGDLWWVTGAEYGCETIVHGRSMFTVTLRNSETVMVASAAISRHKVLDLG